MESSTDMNCVTCKRSFATQEIFNTHLRLHSEDKIHPCDFCGAVFTYKDNLIRHTNIYDSKSCSKLPFVCDICEKILKACDIYYLSNRNQK